MEEGDLQLTQEQTPNKVVDKGFTSASDDKIEDEFTELKYNLCKYCKGIIPKFPKKNVCHTHCAKICSETNKMVMNDNYVYIDSATFDTTAKEWSYYKEVIREKAAPPIQKTANVTGLEPGMKLEALDLNNPVNFCVATVIKIVGHRLCVRYDGFGADPVHDFWCNFQAEELFPIGFCAKHGYALQPPTGITSTLSEWKTFLTRTLTGALAAPPNLFRKAEERRQLRCHPYQHGNKIEVIHPQRPDLIVPATVSKSLGPYYYLVKTDPLPGVPTCYFYGFADCPGVFTAGWCDTRGLILSVPTATQMPLQQEKIKMIRKCESVVDASSHGQKRSRVNPFKIGQKVEAVDGIDIRVATVAEVFGRVAMLVFDGTDKKKFVDKTSVEVFPIGWCEQTGFPLKTPYGKVHFHLLKGGGQMKYQNSNETVNSASFSSFLKSTNTNNNENRYAIVPKDELTNQKKEQRKDQQSLQNTKDWQQHQEQPSQQPEKQQAQKQHDEQKQQQQPQVVLQPSTPKEIDIKKQRTKQESDLSSEVDLVDLSAGDIDMESPISPTSPTSQDKQKSDMEQFIVWLINNYDYDSHDTECIVKPDLTDHFTSSTNIKLSPRWFSLIYKLFPGVSTVRRSVDGKFVNCFRYLKEIKCESADSPIYIKNAVQILKKEGARVILSEEKVVGYMGIGDSYILPDDTKHLFTYGEAKPNSRIFVIHGEIAPDFRVINFRFAFEKNRCSPPLQKVNTIGEFHAMVKLSKQARLCKGVPVVPKADNTTPNYRQGKFVKNGRLYSPACNRIAFSYKMFTCSNCKSIRTHNSRLPSTQLSTPTNHNESMETTEKDDVEESTPVKEDEDNLPSPDIKIYFNKSCYPGIYLDSAKVLKMSAYTDLDRPAQTLKRLVERLIDVSISKEKLLEIIEAGFGTRIFNKSKDKVVKKGLFRFNTRRKIIRFLKRLTKRLHCCEYFLMLDLKECTAHCKKTPDVSANLKTKPKDKDEFFITTISSNTNPNTFVMTTVAGSHAKLTVTGSQGRQGTMLSSSSGNLQVLYQLPVVSTPSSNASTPTTPNTPRILVQTPDGLRNRFPQGTQFFVPSNGNNLTYMVVCKENVVSSINTCSTMTSEIRSPPNHTYNLVSSPSAGVTQMMANISKANLVPDIDDPSKVLMNRVPQISVVKGGTGTNQIIIKKSYAGDKYSDERPKVNPVVSCSQLQPTSNAVTPPTFDDMSRKYHYPRTTNSFSDGSFSQYESHSPAIDKAPHIHVQNVLHGNARVKYVDVKPMEESGTPSRMQNIQIYRKQQQAFHYSPINQHLTVHTPGHSPKSPLHSPPPLRPPPPVGPPRPIALSSPPSLVPSPEICPRFDYIKGGSQPQTPSSVHSPVQVANLNSGKSVSTVKPIHIVGNQNITLPRLPSSYQLSPLAQPGNQLISRGKVTAFQAVRAPVESSSDNRNLPGSSSVSTPAVTMAYIPIQTSSKDKLYYVPVQSSQGQPMVLYQNNQPLKDASSSTSGKSMIIPQQSLQKAANMADQIKSHTVKDQSGNSFTTVRIQGVPRGSLIQVSQMGNVSSSQAIPLKAFKYQFSQAVTGNDNTVQSNSHVTLPGSEPKRTSETNLPGQPHQTNNSLKSEPSTTGNVQGEIMTIINDQLRRVPPQVGVHNSDVKPIIGQKRDSNGMISNSYDTPMNEENSPDHTARKRRGRPPALKSLHKTDGARSKLSLMQVIPLSGSPTGNPITLANRVLTETFHKKQQQLQNRANFLHDPLAKLPNLPTNPENWTPSEVHKFLSETDCASYANLLRNEEIDGKSFLLMTREALMEFMGMRLGPALKIAAHASYLRARHRMQNLSSVGRAQSSEVEPELLQPPKEKKCRLKKEVGVDKDVDVKTESNVVTTTNNSDDVENNGSSVSIGKPMDVDKKMILEGEDGHAVSIEDLNQSLEIPIDIQIDCGKSNEQVEQPDASNHGSDAVDSHFTGDVVSNKSIDSLENRNVDVDDVVVWKSDHSFVETIDQPAGNSTLSENLSHVIKMEEL